jgi:hypothetical protein
MPPNYNFLLFLEPSMKFCTPVIASIAATIALSTSTSALAVTDEEFQNLQEQMNQLASTIEETPDEPSRLHIGSYGEMLYNNLERPDGSTFKQLDFRRFVLFLGYDFSDTIRFHSELEIEHAFVEDINNCTFEVPSGGLTPGDVIACGGETAPGGVELEQAWIEFDLTDNMAARGGLFLVPVGIINELHEPTFFYGVERNPIETRVIPTTWWEGGAGLSGHFGGSGLSYDLAITSGLDGGTDVRGGRQKVAKATANDLAYTGRLKYTGLRGLELSGTAQYQTDMTQSTNPDINDAVLLSAHAIYSIGSVQLRGLYANWNIDVTSDATAEEQSRDVQYGYYLEGSWLFVNSAGVFARYNVWDLGGLGDTERIQTNIGINYWPHEGVVLKFDVQQQDFGAANAAEELDGFNIGIGYYFY